MINITKSLFIFYDELTSGGPDTSPSNVLKEKVAWMIQLPFIRCNPDSALWGQEGHREQDSQVPLDYRRPCD